MPLKSGASVRNVSRRERTSGLPADNGHARVRPKRGDHQQVLTVFAISGLLTFCIAAAAIYSVTDTEKGFEFGNGRLRGIAALTTSLAHNGIHANNMMSSTPVVFEVPPIVSIHPKAANTVQHECMWTKHPGFFLGGLVVPNSPETSEDLAKELCLKNSACAGITCSDSKCTARRGMPFLAESPVNANEVSLTKTCPGDRFDPPLHPLQKLSQDVIPLELDRSMFKPVLESSRQPLGPGRAVIVVIAHNRADCLEKCLGAFVGSADAKVFSLAVSLDDPASFEKMSTVIERYSIQQQISTWKKDAEPGLKTTVQKIAAHFRFALSESFDRHNFEFALFIENDLTLAPDALSYFRSAAWLLEADSSLFCISAWNDNGMKGLVSDQKRLFRTDYFPGLGWMIKSDTWSKIKNIWPTNPTTGWDHWLRHGSGLRPRECIAPEIPRTHHDDDHGTNVKKGNSIYKLLENMAISTLQPGELGDLSYLLADRYEADMKDLIRTSLKVSTSALATLETGRSYVVPYAREEYKTVAASLQIYPSEMRTAHRGVIITRHPKSLATVILVNRRESASFLPFDEQWHPRKDSLVGPARKGESCGKYCSENNLHCEPKELEYVNHCSTLKRYFPCESGCGHQVGGDIPSYVHDARADTAFQCLVTDDVMPSCKDFHKSTTRLCVCVPAPE
mmetsp:Transcript_86147/g.135989  ORF Transcript_86147/g.135989 Transcript_86147/m.135989 type:complete len:678 (-) Transcript_86147:37-2070(-)